MGFIIFHDWGAMGFAVTRSRLCGWPGSMGMHNLESGNILNCKFYFVNRDLKYQVLNRKPEI